MTRAKPEETKTCDRCTTTKPLSEFYRNKQTGRVMHPCKICWRERSLEYQRKRLADAPTRELVRERQNEVRREKYAAAKKANSKVYRDSIRLGASKRLERLRTIVEAMEVSLADPAHADRCAAELWPVAMSLNMRHTPRLVDSFFAYLIGEMAYDEFRSEALESIPTRRRLASMTGLTIHFDA